MKLDNVYNLHLVRLMVLLYVMSGPKNQTIVSGITKLVKLDFLLRYPIALERALRSVGITGDDLDEITYSPKTVESRMIRYKYGPWDRWYREYLAILESKGFLLVLQDVETIKIEITKEGVEFTEKLKTYKEFDDYFSRSTIIKKHFGTMAAMKLKNMMYEIIPELQQMKLGQVIKIGELIEI